MVGLSIPKQEMFAYKLSKFINIYFIISVGAAFDFYIGKVKQALGWVQKLIMEWLAGLLMGPNVYGKGFLKLCLYLFFIIY